MKVAELYDIKKGKKPGEILFKNDPGNIRFIQIEDLRSNDELKFTRASNDQVLCDETDLLLVWDGAYSGLVSYGLKGAFGSTLARLRPKLKTTWTPYVGRFLESKLNEIQQNRTGATIPHVSGPYLKNLQIPLPPLEEQKRIAAILDAADSLRARRRESIDRLDELVQSTFLEMFGDPVSNPKGWEMKPLKEGVESFVGGRNLMPTEKERQDSIRILKVSAVTSGEYRAYESKPFSERESVIEDHMVKKGDLLISRANTAELVGSVVYV